jgi:prepilin-type processing-associated H-X9-DG protein
VLRCPDDVSCQVGAGDLSYAVNGGFARWPAIPVSWTGTAHDGQSTNGDVLHWAAPGATWQQNMAIASKLGVMFLGTRTGDQPWDVHTTAASIVDGSSNTLLVAENILAGHTSGNRYSGHLPTNWACPLPNFVMFLASDNVCYSASSMTDCRGGQLQAVSAWKDGPGWARANAWGTFENINYGRNFNVEGSFPFANSGHQGGGNFAFCDGAIRYLTETIDGTVYAKLITPAGGKLPAPFAQNRLEQDAFAQ